MGQSSSTAERHPQEHRVRKVPFWQGLTGGACLAAGAHNLLCAGHDGTAGAAGAGAGLAVQGCARCRIPVVPIAALLAVRACRVIPAVAHAWKREANGFFSFFSQHKKNSPLLPVAAYPSQDHRSRCAHCRCKARRGCRAPGRGFLGGTQGSSAHRTAPRSLLDRSSSPPTLRARRPLGQHW